jgi:hypothetical protein
MWRKNIVENIILVGDCFWWRTLDFLPTITWLQSSQGKWQMCAATVCASIQSSICALGDVNSSIRRPDGRPLRAAGF